MTMTQLTVTMAVVVSLAGCSMERESTPNAEGPQGVFHQAALHAVATREYIIDPPDEIILHAPNIKELDGQRQKVRPDGKVSFNVLGEVFVAGMSATRANALLKELAAKYYQNPDIKIEVIANSKFYYVFGFGAATPGRIPYTGRDTVITALAQAGFNNQAWPQQVRLSRPARDGQANATAVIDFKKIWGYGDLTQNYLVEEGDIIQVPYSPLAAWNEKMTRIVGPLTGTATLALTAAVLVNANNDNNGGLLP